MKDYSEIAWKIIGSNVFAKLGSEMSDAIVNDIKGALESVAKERDEEIEKLRHLIESTHGKAMIDVAGDLFEKDEEIEKWRKMFGESQLEVMNLQGEADKLRQEIDEYKSGNLAFSVIIEELKAEIKTLTEINKKYHPDYKEVSELRHRVEVLEVALKEVQGYFLGEGGIPHGVAYTAAEAVSKIIDKALHNPERKEKS